MTKVSIAIGLIAVTTLVSCATHKNSTVNKEAMNTFPAFDKEGHRGGRGLMPENTIPAMHNAIDLGVTTLEMDASISKDKKVVVSHDPYFNSDITTTPEGKTLTKQEGMALLLYGMDYNTIKKYDVGLKPHPGFPRQQKIAVHKPLLSELIASSEEYAKKKGHAPLWYNIETKSMPSGDGVKHPAPEEFVDLLVAVINEAGIANRTVIQSFDIRTLQVIHKKYPQFKTSLLMEATDKRSLDEQLNELGFVPFVYSPNYALLSTQLVNACHAKGMKVVPWTLNTKELIEQAKTYGVDGIITDYPDLYNN
ncbi:glycerophosphodiester phosphodiesterase [Flavisolibacter tropicus]|uniref:Glycerophosphodiester phosphodiesterase n=2 Tax=Flavisolibacter tropicus TaxID=1492898 RepID=A0A172TRU1_9BACT|nr:glycerophosphodiester phosphodiesterase [Flavisolibacter tropicus]